MRTFAELKTFIQDRYNDTSSKVDTRIESLVGVMVGRLRGTMNWEFARRTRTDTTVASQTAYNLPIQTRMIRSVKITVGGVDYYPVPVASVDQWDSLFTGPAAGSTSDIPLYYHIKDDSIEFYPTPASNSNTITYDSYERFKVIVTGDFTDKTAGTISITNGATTVTGGGTAFATTDVDRYILLGGHYYRIATFASTTEIGIERNYEGTTLSGAAYILGSTADLEEEHLQYVASECLALLWLDREDRTLYNVWASVAKDLRKEIKKHEDMRFASPGVSAVGDLTNINNPNDHPTGLTS